MYVVTSTNSLAQIKTELGKNEFVLEQKFLLYILYATVKKLTMCFTIIEKRYITDIFC